MRTRWMASTVGGRPADWKGMLLVAEVMQTELLGTTWVICSICKTRDSDSGNGIRVRTIYGEYEWTQNMCSESSFDAHDVFPVLVLVR